MKPKLSGKKIDWMITLVPLGIVVALCVIFFFMPEQSNAVLSQIRFFFGDTFGTYYLVIGLGIFLLSLFIACSKYGNIVLGDPGEKPKYSFFAWGSMMFTCGLAADILFYSFAEWILYATDPHIEELGGVDIAFGGIGITGHLAFNEPQPELTPEQFAQLPTRVLDIHPETRATNCVGDLGGALEDMPHKCVTIGMKEILGARKLRLGVFRDWHRAVCRRAAYGEITAAFPATLAQKHPDALLYVNSVAAGQAY